MVSEPLENLVTTKELAEELGISRHLISEAAKAGEIPGTHQILGRYYFELEKARAEWNPSILVLAEGGSPPSHDPKGTPGYTGRGRPFAKGNVLGAGSSTSGRKSRAKEAAYLIRLHECVSIEDWEAVCIRALEDAKEGDRHARRWLSEYLLGKPAQRIIADIDIEHSQKLTTAERLIILKELLGLEQALTKEHIIDARAAVRVLEGPEPDEAATTGQSAA